MRRPEYDNPMTVGELMEILQELPPEMPVFICTGKGHEPVLSHFQMCLDFYDGGDFRNGWFNADDRCKWQEPNKSVEAVVLWNG